MKYSKMSEAQQAAYRDILGTIVNIKSQEEQKYTHDAFRLLVLGNAAGIAILAVFMGNLASKGDDFGALIVPLAFFFIGTILAALTYVPLVAVANQATIHIVNQINDFFLDKLEFEQIRGYGFNVKGRRIVAALLGGSFTMFCMGVFGRLVILKGIGGKASLDRITVLSNSMCHPGP